MNRIRLYLGRVKRRRPTTTAIVPSLLKWFSENARELPWRQTRDPYAIWVSEIMLQQTQVKTVIPYWERWMRELPDLAALAAAPPDRVLKLWEGLGYYTRPRNLQKAAQVILKEHRGKFPDRFDDILDLPGVGRYTAGAIASIAFNQPRPVLDGNVMRVLCRLYAVRDNPREKSCNRRLWAIAERLVVEAAGQNPKSEIQSPKATRNPNAEESLDEGKISGRVSSDFGLRSSFGIRRSDFGLPPACSHLNQALMELGATLCTPRQPQCAACPVKHHCQAFQLGIADQLPKLGRRAQSIRRRVFVLLLEKRGRFLVHRKPPKTVNAHLWEFPSFEQATAPKAPQIKAELNLSIGPVTPFTTLRHSITRYRIELRAYRALCRAGKPRGPDWRWIALADLERLAFSSAHRKLAQRLAQSPTGKT